jgi:hypothetical protein
MSFVSIPPWGVQLCLAHTHTHAHRPNPPTPLTRLFSWPTPIPMPYLCAPWWRPGAGFEAAAGGRQGAGGKHDTQLQRVAVQRQRPSLSTTPVPCPRPSARPTPGPATFGCWQSCGPECKQHPKRGPRCKYLGDFCFLQLQCVHAVRPWPWHCSWHCSWPEWRWKAVWKWLAVSRAGLQWCGLLSVSHCGRTAVPAARCGPRHPSHR